jgi:NAD(P)-dependent dehydrogenase (short-subunit alcohol dehydrogenase family)
MAATSLAGVLKDKHVILTGSDSPLGQAIGREFSAHGAKCCGIGRDSKGAHVTLKDYTDLEGTKKAVQEALQKLGGKVDILVNCAGGIDKDMIGYDAMTKVLNSNIVSAQMCSEELYPELKKSEAGGIINVACAVGSLLPMPGDLMNYGVAKAGVMELTKGHALQFAPHVRVNAVCPGLFEGDEIMTVLAGGDKGKEKEMMERAAKAMPLGRIGKPEGIAAAILYLAHQSYGTGQCLVLDSGASLTNWLNHPTQGLGKELFAAGQKKLKL